MRVRIGDRGRAVSALRPSGEVMLGDNRWPARCESGWAESGVEVIVVAAEAFGLVVRLAGSVSQEGLPGVGTVVPSAQESAERRDRQERQVRAEEEHSGTLRSNRAFAVYLLAVVLPAGALGAWLGGELGLKIALAVVIGIPLLLYAWASS